jgi:hypothetical protein
MRFYPLFLQGHCALPLIASATVIELPHWSFPASRKVTKESALECELGATDVTRHHQTDH